MATRHLGCGESHRFLKTQVFNHTGSHTDPFPELLCADVLRRSPRHVEEPEHCCAHRPLRGDESSVCRSTWFFIPLCSQLDQDNTDFTQWTDTCICRAHTAAALWRGKHHLWFLQMGFGILNVWAIVHKCSCSSPPILPCSLRKNILPYVFLTLMGMATVHTLAHRT